VVTEKMFRDFGHFYKNQSRMSFALFLLLLLLFFIKIPVFMSYFSEVYK